MFSFGEKWLELLEGGGEMLQHHHLQSQVLETVEPLFRQNLHRIPIYKVNYKRNVFISLEINKFIYTF